MLMMRNNLQPKPQALQPGMALAHLAMGHLAMAHLAMPHPTAH